MIRHVVLLKWNEGVSAAHRAAAAEALGGLPAVIDEIRSFHHGPDLGLVASNFDYAIVAEFASAEDQAIYRNHPLHVEVIQKFLDGYSIRHAAQINFG